MPRAATSVKATYGDIRHPEIGLLGLIYYDRFKLQPSELAPFTAYDATLDDKWLKKFGASIKLTQSIKPAAQVIKEGKVITQQINTLSASSVKLGRELVYWLKQAYSAMPAPELEAFLDEVPTIAANDAMRNGDTETMLLHLGSVLERLAYHRTQLDATGYPAGNATAFQQLYDNVTTLNTQQSSHRLAIPDGTDRAQTQRNETFAYIRRILDLNDILPDRTATKAQEYRVAPALKTMRAAKAKAAAPKASPPFTA